MKSLAFLVGATVITLFALSKITGEQVALSAAPTADEILRAGQRVYEANCAICHGQNGNGRGSAAHMMVTQPRDFRQGWFKFRSTPTGALPTDDDILKVVTEGIRWTAMVGRADLSEVDWRAVVQYVKTFSPRFTSEKSPAPITVGGAPARRRELIAQGRQLFRDLDCAKCHGERADGRGISSAELTDDWGWPLPAGDLTWQPLKRGSQPRDLYLTIATGLNGTSMPAYNAALDGGQIWALVYYLESLVPEDHQPSARQMLGEEQSGWMILRMHGGMGRGMMR